MQIELKKKEPSQKFRDTDPGDTFLWDGQVWIASAVLSEAMRLATGDMRTFADKEPVEIVELVAVQR
jgi:hypothetical protein